MGKRKTVEKKDNTFLHPNALAAYKIIRSHAAVIDTKLPAPVGKSGFVINFSMEVSLPSRRRRLGISDTGVKSREPIKMIFHQSFPYSAPAIYLRHDFNDKLPHINPSLIYNTKEGLCPCVYDGSLDELLLRDADGLSEIINCLSEWLRKAAIDKLMDPDQGWEPIRRDGISGWIVFDSSRMRSVITETAGALTFRGRFLQMPQFEQMDPLTLGIINDLTPQKVSAGLISNLYGPQRIDEALMYESLVFVVWSKDDDLSRRYTPDNVNTLCQLFTAADQYGCKDKLQNSLNEFLCAVGKNFRTYQHFPLFIVLCARRPMNIIGDDSNLELIPYKIDCQIQDGISLLGGAPQISDSSPVEALGHRYAISRSLLRRMSGCTTNEDFGHIVLIGCGSIGSKIALHFARAGHGPFTLIDKGILSPHNAARHALTFSTELPFNLHKSYLLAEEIKKFHQKAVPVQGDFVNIHRDSSRELLFPSDTSLVIDSTGSIKVREYLASLDSKKLPGRLIHVALYNNGQIGIVAIEGKSRNPNVSDLIAEFWNTLVDDRVLSSTFMKAQLDRTEIGLGCGSHTMIMPDTIVSLHSAGMAEMIRQKLERGLSDSGEIWIGVTENSGFGITWEHQTIEQSVILKIRTENKWEIRILKRAMDQITEDAKKWKDIETGGVLIGRISLNRRCIIVTRMLEAPPDSTRSKTSFVLGKEGLRKKVTEIYERSGRTLSYVGTWHSHPCGPKEASSTDRISFERIKQLRLGAPALYLIWTPSGIGGIIDEGKLS